VGVSSEVEMVVKKCGRIGYGWEREERDGRNAPLGEGKWEEG